MIIKVSWFLSFVFLLLFVLCFVWLFLIQFCFAFVTFVFLFRSRFSPSNDLLSNETCFVFVFLVVFLVAPIIAAAHLVSFAFSHLVVHIKHLVHDG